MRPWSALTGGAEPGDPATLARGLAAWLAQRLGLPGGPAGEVVVRARCGLRFRVPAESVHLVLPRSEPLGYAMLVGLAGRGPFVDAGAFAGGYALRAALAGMRPVLAFEPDPRALRLLLHNIELNRLRGAVRAYPHALADRRGRGVLHLGRAHGRSSLLAGPGAAGSVEVPVARLDDFAGELGGCPRMVKVDVEGAAHLVLRGAAGILEACRPPVYIEAHTGEELLRSLEQLEALGYRAWVAVQGPRAYVAAAHPSSPGYRAVEEAVARVSAALGGQRYRGGAAGAAPGGAPAAAERARSGPG